MTWLVLYIATIFAANWALATVGILPIAGGIPAGVLFAGLAFTFRDLTQDRLGRLPVAGAIVVGALFSAALSPTLALASGAAFLVSEAADFAAYTPLRKHRWLTAVTLSNTLGLALDSVLFLFLAFGSLAFLPGQIIGKAVMTVLAVGTLWVWRESNGRVRARYGLRDSSADIAVRR